MSSFLIHRAPHVDSGSHVHSVEPVGLFFQMHGTTFDFQHIPRMHVYVLCMPVRASECTVHNCVFVCACVQAGLCVLLWAWMETIFSSASLFSACSLLLSFCSHPILYSLCFSSHHHHCYVTVGRENTAFLSDAAYNTKLLLKIPLFCGQSCVEFSLAARKNGTLNLF